MILLIILSALFLQSKAQDGFRYDANGLQILINSEWFYVVNTPTFSFMEANFICTEFLDSTFLRYQLVTDPGVNTLTEINCTPRNCSVSNALEDLNSQQLVNVTCLDAPPEEKATTRLRDGSLATLVIVNNESFWGQFCHYNNNGWDLHTATLACRKAGYTGVFPGKEKLLIVKSVVFGIEQVNCENATSFEECDYAIAVDKGRCDLDKVIQVECINDEITVPTVSVIPTTTSTVPTTTNTRSSSPTTSYMGSSQSKTSSFTSSYTTSVHVTTLSPTNSPFLNVNWMFILVGLLLFITLLSIGVVVILVIGCCYCLKKEKSTDLFNLDHLYGGNPNCVSMCSTCVPTDQFYQ